MRLLAPLLVLAAATLARGAAAGGPVDLSALFAPPTPGERDAVQAEWAARVPGAPGWQVETSGTLASGATLQVVSFLLDGDRLHGALRFPKTFTPGGSFPLLVYNHGGVGVSLLPMLDELDGALTVGPCLEDEFFVLVTSFPGEQVQAAPFGSYGNGGALTFFEREGEALLGFLDGALAATPQIDVGRIVSYGWSRGGYAAVQAAVRDPRTLALCEVSAQVDFTLPSIQAGAETLIATGGTTSDRVLQLVVDECAQPYVDGTLSLADARAWLLRRSSAWFAARLPRTEVHHGALDDDVPIEMSQALAAQVAALPGSPCFALYEYPAGGHNPLTLDGAPPLIEALLCGVVDGGYGRAVAYGGACAGGAAGPPSLGVTGCLEPGAPITIEVQGAVPGDLAWLLVGLLPGAVPFKGGCTVLVAPPITFVPLAPTSPNGLLYLTAPLPASVPSGLAFVLQSVLAPSLATTAGVAVEIP